MVRARSLIVVLVAAACSNEPADVGALSSSAGGPPDGVCYPSGDPDIPEVCAFDNDFTYPVVPIGGVEPGQVLPAGGPYGVWFRLTPSFHASLGEPRLRVSVGPYDGSSQPCCAEDDPANDVPFDRADTGDGFWVRMIQPIDEPNQVAVTLRIAADAAYLVRFYVVARPTTQPID